MDSAFNQPTSTTPERNWQLDQCYKEGCKLERELATVAEQRDEARAVLVYEQGGIHATAGGWAAKYAEAIEQRKKLTYALVMCRRELVDVLDDINKERVPHDGDDFHEALRISKEALAAVDGGSDE
jgi:hypothetical protein